MGVLCFLVVVFDFLWLFVSLYDCFCLLMIILYPFMVVLCLLMVILHCFALKGKKNENVTYCHINSLN